MFPKRSVEWRKRRFFSWSWCGDGSNGEEAVEDEVLGGKRVEEGRACYS